MILLLIVILSIFVLYKFFNLSIEKLILVSLLFSIIVNISLAQNITANLIPSTEGLAIYNFLARVVIGENNWSVKLFKSYFNYSTIICLMLLVSYLVTLILNNKN